MKKLLSVLLTISVSFVFLTGATSSTAREMCQVSAEYAAVVELSTGRLICGKNHTQRASMASTTKIMTALLLCEAADLEEEIIATDQMVKVEGTSMGLIAGDKVHYRDLLYGLLLASGNDAANATAISIAGSLDEFAVMMNERAKQIGMNDTNFVTPSGLDDENHYTTAYDMALLACEAMKNPDFAEACSAEYATLEYGSPPFRRTLRNHNKLLRMYDDCVGVKTGFTKKSGRCLVSCAVKDGKGVVAVTLNAPDDWNDHIRMLNYGIGQLQTRQLTVPELHNVYVVGGEKQTVGLTISELPEASLLPEDFERITVSVNVQNPVFAPLKKDEQVGTAEWMLDGKIIATKKLMVTDNVDISDSPLHRDIIFWIGQLISA